MRVDRDAAAVVGDGEESVGAQFDFDERRVSRQRLVHRVVDDFGKQMMQRLLVGAANVHAGAAAHRLKAFEHLDVGRRVACLGAGTARRELERGPALRRAVAKQIVGSFCFSVGFQWFRHIVSCVARAAAAANRLMPDYATDELKK